MKTLFKKLLEYLFPKYFKLYDLYAYEKEPIAFMYENTTDKDIEHAIFGLESVQEKEGLKITYLNNQDIPGGGLGAMRMINSRIALESKIIIGGLRVSFNPIDRERYMPSSLRFHKADANGKEFSQPTVILNAIDCYQQQNNIADINTFNTKEVNSRTHISFSVKSKSTLFITIFPIKHYKVSYKDFVREMAKSELRKYVVIEQTFNGGLFKLLKLYFKHKINLFKMRMLSDRFHKRTNNEFK
jgi:hypothetical protein